MPSLVLCVQLFYVLFLALEDVKRLTAGIINHSSLRGLDGVRALTKTGPVLTLLGRLVLGRLENATSGENQNQWADIFGSVSSLIFGKFFRRNFFIQKYIMEMNFIGI
jgi:hypothetical protein